ncbi:helix-turn-helix transcriptional regulator [Lacisediminihabitans changchengi]|uniref:AAA family ATPase n=1 Tax=Lacisediminihabitans changchengi TaxID=2787634 RepID=A0A934SJF2_9MICO|nr:LuxR family transcriptional regulator [Lacisediminihabitans changchengi]MBK4346391.1 AAA family ATPase [Lacisediminihabitans changchengi]
MPFHTDGPEYRVKLIGRDGSLAALAAVLSGSTPQRALLVRGEPGVGKTALLDATAARADSDGAAVYRCVGVETEAGIELSGLHQLLRPVIEHTESLPARSRAVLQDAFDGDSGGSAGRFALANAVLELVSCASFTRSLLLVVDDVQWIDESSVQTLAFVARRIVNPRVSLIGGVRTDAGQHSDAIWDRAGIPLLDIAPLGPGHSEELLAQRALGLSDVVRRRILREAVGNPLALTELPETFASDRGDDDRMENGLLPLTRRLEIVFAGRANALSSGARAVALLCALDQTSSLDTVQRASGEDWWFPDLVEAGEAGILRIKDGHISFRHPLIRSGIVQMATEEQLRRAHGRLADALSDNFELWARHSAAATTGPDATVADALEQLGRQYARRGGTRTSLRTMLRSIELTADQPARERRLAYAALLAADSDRVELTHSLLSRLEDTVPLDDFAGGLGDTLAGAVTAKAGILLRVDGDLQGAYDLLMQAARRQAGPVSAEVDALLHLLLIVCLRAEREDMWQGVDRLLDALGERVPAEIRNTRDGISDPARRAHGLAERLAIALPRPGSLEPWRLVWVYRAGLFIDDLGARRPALRSIIEAEELSGSYDSYLRALGLVVVDCIGSGEWQYARSLAERGLQTALHLDFAEIVSEFRVYLALLDAVTGHIDSSRQNIATVRAWAGPRRMMHLESWALWAEALGFLGEHDYDAAFMATTRISPAGELRRYHPLALSTFFDTALAALHAGDEDAARRHLAAAQQARVGEISPRLGFQVAVIRALLAPAQDAAALFDAALADRDAERWPLDYARAQQEYGEWLRRAKQRTAARSHLRVAADVFERLGAQAWLADARNSLRLVGVQNAHSTSQTAVMLTAQERQIATLAAQGRSNKDIAALLSLSPRTVSSHLYKIFPKLGISSRAALHSALSEMVSQG